MTRYLGNYKQGIAVDMRKKGLSYSEIGNKIHVPKSTLSFWLKDVQLTEEQIKKLNDKRISVAKANALKKVSKTSKLIEEIKTSSAEDIKEISKKELWLMGIMLYWKNGNKSDMKKGVHFSSSDPILVKLFLKWLKEVGRINDGEVKFEVFLKDNCKDKNELKEKAVSYWSEITGFPRTDFQKNYFQKAHKRKTSNNANNGVAGKNCGFLRIKVAKSSMLARQIAGWMDRIKEINKLA